MPLRFQIMSSFEQDTQTSEEGSQPCYLLRHRGGESAAEHTKG